MDMFKCVLNFEAKKRDPLVIFGVTILGNHTKSHLIGVSSAYDSSALPGLVEFKGGILREETRSGLAGPMWDIPLAQYKGHKKKNIKMDAGGKSIKHIIYFCVFCLESPVFRSIPFPAFGTWPRRPSRVRVAKQDSIFLWSAATACGFPRLRLHHLLMWRMMENIIGV